MDAGPRPIAPATARGCATLLRDDHARLVSLGSSPRRQSCAVRRLRRATPVVAVYLHAPGEEGPWQPGARPGGGCISALTALGASLATLGTGLCVRASDDSLTGLQRPGRANAQRHASSGTGATSRRSARAMSIIKRHPAGARHRRPQLLPSALLHEPWSITHPQRRRVSGVHAVLAPAANRSATRPSPCLPRKRCARPAGRARLADHRQSRALAEARLADRSRDGLDSRASRAASDRLERFAERPSRITRAGATCRGIPGTSRLSPHLHFGEIGAAQIWHAVRRRCEASGPALSWRDSQFLAEIGWREFAHHLLYHFPHTPEQPLRAKFRALSLAVEPGVRCARGSAAHRLSHRRCGHARAMAAPAGCTIACA